MKLVVRNPSLFVLVGWILLGLSVQKSQRPREWRAPETRPVAETLPRAGVLERLRQAWNLWKQRHRDPIGLGLRP